MVVIFLFSPVVKKNLTAEAGVRMQTNHTSNAQEQYTSPTSKEDCLLCGDNTDNPLSFYWGENNLAVLDLNTFEFYTLEINRYDNEKNLITSEAGFMQIAGHTFQNGESLSARTDPDRGYAEVSIQLGSNYKLSLDELSSHLCSDCLTKLMNQYFDGGDHWNLALLDFDGKTIRPLEESITSFGLGDFIIWSSYDKGIKNLDLLVWYSPARYK